MRLKGICCEYCQASACFPSLPHTVSFGKLNRDAGGTVTAVTVSSDGLR